MPTVLKLGDSGEKVARLQRALKSFGFDIADDGSFGPQTLDTVKAFQSREGLTADGIAGPFTIEALDLDTDTLEDLIVIDGAGGTPGASSPLQRMLFVDVYSGDVGGKPNWPAVVAAPDFIGAIIKATNGVSFNTTWFDFNWKALRTVAGDRYCATWFRGAYHFLLFNRDANKQAQFYLETIEKAGGLDSGDLIPIVDVELGNDGSSGKPRHPNQDATKAQIIDVTSAWITYVTQRTDAEVMLYGRGAMRDRGIREKMGANWLWNPSYTRTMPRQTIEKVGWTIPEVALWQYCGDGDGKLQGYPTEVKDFGKVDISVCLLDDVSKVIEKLLIKR